MDIHARNDFAASGEHVWAMLTDSDFLTAVCQASEPLEFTVSVDGAHTQTRRVMTTPPQAASVAGPTVTIVDQITWEPDSPFPREGAALITVEGLPARVVGTVTLETGGRGTVLNYSGELHVDVPLIGPMLAKKSAPLLLDALRLQQRVGDEYLASHS